MPADFSVPSELQEASQALSDATVSLARVFHVKGGWVEPEASEEASVDPGNRAAAINAKTKQLMSSTSSTSSRS